jgi:AraC-like DNA-binding protein
VSDSYQEIAPSRRLSPYVECYWSREEQPGAPSHRILPDGCVDILFVTLNREPIALTVVGLMTTPLTCAVQPGRSYFAVRFRPGMAAAFIREAALLNDRIEPLESLWGTTARSLAERLSESSTSQRRAQVMEGSLRPLEPPDSAQRALWRLSEVTVPLDCLASDAGLSERHFRRACVQRAGVPPKYMRRILRFRRAAERIRAREASTAQPNWAQFAVACGYYDQAHLIREFQEFAGCTPGRFVQSQNRGRGLESNNHEPSET